VIAAPIVPSLLAAAGTAGANSDLFLNVLPALNAISDPAVIVNAVSQLAPSNSALAAPQVTFDSARAFQTLVSSQLVEGLCGPESQTEDRRRADAQSGSGDQPKRNDENSGCNNQYSGLWLKGFGYFGDQRAQGAFSGYDSTILGAMLGYDVAVSDDTRAGAGIGFAHSKINGKVFSNATAFTSYQATAYIAHDDGTWFAGGDVSYGRNNYSGSRKIAFTTINRTALAKYSGSDITGFATAGRHFFVDDVTITPLSSLQFTHINLGSYTETGAGDINLQVAAQRYDMLESGLGATATRHFALEDGQDFVPELHLKWLHELANPNVSNTATFTATGATPFVTLGLNQSADTLNGGAGLTLLSCGCTERTWSVEGIYDFYWRNQNYSAHQVTLAAAYRF
jgi:outer membrane autotransporter protein